METITTDDFLTAFQKRREIRNARLVAMYARLRKIYPDISETRMYKVMEEHGAGASVTTISKVMQANGLTKKWPGRGRPKGTHKETTK